MNKETKKFITFIFFDEKRFFKCYSTGIRHGTDSRENFSQQHTSENSLQSLVENVFPVEMWWGESSDEKNH
jgi:hypothetical protein